MTNVFKVQPNLGHINMGNLGFLLGGSPFQKWCQLYSAMYMCSETE